MPGERFSALYVRSADPVQENPRARHRVGALFGETVFADHTERLAAQLGRELGIPVPGGGQHSADWHAFIRECNTPSFLDAVTVVYRYLFWHADEQIANWWRDVVRQIFADERLAYEIDDVGGVHPAVDPEFQRNMTCALAALQSPPYQSVREAFDSASKLLNADPPNYKKAWLATLSALEIMFGLMFPYARLTVDEIERRLRPVVERAYGGDATAQGAALRMSASFREWVEASRGYRHEPGAVESAQPPADIAILAISHGASFLRWLAGLDEDRPA